MTRLRDKFVCPPRRCLLPSIAVFLLNAVLMFDPAMRAYVDQHVRVLPFRRWAGDMHVMVSPPPAQVNHRAPSEMRKKIWEIAVIHHYDDQNKAEQMCAWAQTIKFTTDMPYNFDAPMETLLAAPTTFGRVLRYAVNSAVVEPATMDGATAVVMPTLVRPSAPLE